MMTLVTFLLFTLVGLLILTVGIGIMTFATAAVMGRAEVTISSAIVYGFASSLQLIFLPVALFALEYFFDVGSMLKWQPPIRGLVYFLGTLVWFLILSMIFLKLNYSWSLEEIRWFFIVLKFLIFALMLLLGLIVTWATPH